MKQFAYIVNGIAHEIIPARLEIDGVDVPIEDRYTPEFIASLVPYDPENPPLAPEPPTVTAAQVLAERSARMAQASAEIEPLQDLVEMDEADEDDEAKLLEWKQYRAAVSKVQTQPGYPSAVVWPDVPTI